MRRLVHGAASRRPVAAGGVLLLAACSGDAAAGADPARYALPGEFDASVVVDNPAPDPNAPSFELAAAPEIRAGERSDDALEEELWRVRDAVVTSWGRLVVSLNDGREVRVFGPPDRFVDRVGLIGQGPGEFLEATQLVALPGDSLLIFDRRAGRITAYTPSGDYARSVPSGMFATCCLRDGGYLVGPSPLRRIDLRWPEAPPVIEWSFMEGWSRPPRPSGTFRAPESDPFVAVPVQGFLEGFAGRIPPRLETMPFSRTSSVAVVGDRVVYGIGDRFEYRAYAGDGTLRQVVRAAVPQRAVSPEDVESARSAFIARGEAAAATATTSPAREIDFVSWYERAFDDLELPETVPAYGRILGEEDGSVWVSGYSVERVPDDGEWWARFTPEGRLAGTLRIPPGRTVIRFSQGRAIVRVVDPAYGFHILGVHAIEALAP